MFLLEVVPLMKIMGLNCYLVMKLIQYYPFAILLKASLSLIVDVYFLDLTKMEI